MLFWLGPVSNLETIYNISNALTTAQNVLAFCGQILHVQLPLTFSLEKKWLHLLPSGSIMNDEKKYHIHKNKHNVSHTSSVPWKSNIKIKSSGAWYFVENLFIGCGGRNTAVKRLRKIKGFKESQRMLSRREIFSMDKTTPVEDKAWHLSRTWGVNQ